MGRPMVTAADDGDAGTVDRDVVAAQQRDDAARRARQRRRAPQDQAAQVDRCRPSASLRVDPLQCGVLVEVARQRQLHDVSGAGVIGVELVDSRVELVGRRIGRQVAADRVDADLRAVVVLALHIGLRPGSSPTRTVPRPGSMPAALSRWTRAARSSKISSRVTIPSESNGAHAAILPRRPRRARAGGALTCDTCSASCSCSRPSRPTLATRSGWPPTPDASSTWWNRSDSR